MLLWHGANCCCSLLRRAASGEQSKFLTSLVLNIGLSPAKIIIVLILLLEFAEMNIHLLSESADSLCSRMCKMRGDVSRKTSVKIKRSVFSEVRPVESRQKTKLPSVLFLDKQS